MQLLRMVKPGTVFSKPRSPWHTVLHLFINDNQDPGLVKGVGGNILRH